VKTQLQPQAAAWNVHRLPFSGLLSGKYLALHVMLSQSAIDLLAVSRPSWCVRNCLFGPPDLPGNFQAAEA